MRIPAKNTKIFVRKKTLGKKLFVLLLLLFAPPLFPVFSIFSIASASQLAEEVAEIVALETALMGEEYALRAILEGTIETEIDRVRTQASHYALLVARDKKIAEEYVNDHKPLEDKGDEKNKAWSDSLAEITVLYAVLSKAGALSFPMTPLSDSISSDDFKAGNPGYREPGGGYVDYAAEYKKSMDDWQIYSLGLLGGNTAGTELVVSAQKTVADMYKASKNAEYYRRLLQADNQILLLAARETENLRTDAMRQVEARTKFALNERQERTDTHAAFKQALREWKGQFAPKGY